jgi:hypothetical protein
MKQKGKFTVTNNRTLDQYLKPKQLLPSKPEKDAIRVPPNSGLAGLTVPDSAVLVADDL